MNVSIIIVNYNTRQLLYNCIESIYKNTSDLDFEIIIVDNASSDGSKEFITSHFPEVRWIQSTTNLGFGKANNLGARYATGEYLFLLNSDTILLNNAISIFYNYIKSQDPDDNKIGIIGCQLVDEHNKPNTAGGNFIKPFNNRVITPANGFTHNTEIDYVMGADMFLSRKLFEEVRGFDEDFFMYCEEVDLQRRIYLSGRKNYIITEPQIIHLEGASFKDKSKGLTFNKYIMWQNSRNLYASKHFKGMTMFLWKLEMLILNPRIILREKWPFKNKLKAFAFSLGFKID